MSPVGMNNGEHFIVKMVRCRGHFLMDPIVYWEDEVVLR